MRGRIGCLVVGAPLLLLAAPPWTYARDADAEIAATGKTHESLNEVARQIDNPISTLWQLTLDNPIVVRDGGGLDGPELAYTGTFQPTMPVNLSRFALERFEWARRFNVITRLTIPFAETVPLPAASGGSRRKTGFGDIQLGSVLAPNERYGIVWGLGPIFIFPSASDDALGQGKWQAGPAAVAGYQSRQWTAYVLAEQWWSFAGDDDRPDTSQLSLNYVLLRNLPHRWQVGFQPTISVDWKASGDDAVSLPVGLGVGKTIRIGRLPVQFWVEADYYPVRPDDLPGPRWGVDIQITPVISELD